jgi:Tfp pilus assembly protein PilW
MRPDSYNRPSLNQGFSLLELLLYVSLSAIMLLVISVFLSTLLQARLKNQTIAEVEQQGDRAMTLILQTLRNADSITSPAVGNTAAALSFNVLTPIKNPTVFNIINGIINISEGAGGPVALTNNRVTASGLSFQNLSRASTPGIVRIQFTLTAVNNSGRQEYSFSKTFISSASLRWP